MSHDADQAPAEAEPKKKRFDKKLKRLTLAVVFLAVGTVGVIAWQQVAPTLAARKYRTVVYRVPAAPKLTAGKGETVYRIDPTQSSLTYRIGEKFVGRSTSTATGVTNGLAGDIAVSDTKASGVRFGDVVANLEQFHSDNGLRDARIRADFLESHRYPLARFHVTKVSGLSGALEPGKRYPFTLQGTATIKQETAPVTFTGTASIEDGRLKAKATTTTKLSTFDAGPISISGLLSTEDEVELTLALTALDPTEHTIPTRITGPGAKEPDAKGSPSFARTVQPILEANCATCHNTGQMGADHIRIDTAGDARAIADGLKVVTQTGYMPPWPASDEGVPLAHKTTLTLAQKRAIAAWADAGGILDVPARTKITPTKAAQALQPRKDLTLRISGYKGSADNSNDYRCFILDPKLTKPQYLTGYTFLGDQIPELHHAQVFHISAEELADARTKDGADGKPGWQCYGSVSLRGRPPAVVPGREFKRDAGFAGQAGLVAGWVPGQSPVIFPERSGFLIEPGDALVLQLHYHYAKPPTLDRSGLALQLDPISAKIRATRTVNPLGPVEIPCNPKDAKAPLCDREKALQDNVRLYGGIGAGNEAGLLLLCQKTPEELTKDFDGNVARSSCLTKVPEDGTMTGLMGHMHTLGSTFRLTLDPGSSRSKVLLDIPHWSFDWQMNYQLETPIHVKAGQEILMECSWDRRADPDRPPKYIVFAEGTEDEMCFGTYSLIPDDQ